MNQSVTEAPAASRESTDQRRGDLITATSRLAFEVEAAEREGARLEIVRLRIEYHQAMADLLALTSSWSPDGQRKVSEARDGHLDVLAGYRAEMKRLEGGAE